MVFAGMVSEAHKMVQESEDRAHGLEQLAQDVYKQACVRIQELVNVAENLYQSNYGNQASSSQLLTEEVQTINLGEAPRANPSKSDVGRADRTS
jgi:hypothetical protein